MKKFLSLLIVTAFIFATGVSFAKAESNSGGIRKHETPPKAEANEAQIESRKLEKAEQERKLEEKRQEIINNFEEKVSERFDNIVQKLEERYNKLSEKVSGLSQKYDTTSLQKLLTEARTELDAAKAKIQEAKTIFAGLKVTNLESFQEARQTIRKTTKEMKDAIKKTKEKLVDVIKAMKPGQLKPAEQPANPNTPNQNAQ